MKSLMMALFVTGALASAQSALCQTVSAATPAAQPDPARLALARQLVELSGGEQQYKAQMAMMISAMEKGMAKAIPADQSQLLNPIYDAMGQELATLAPQLMDMSVRINAENFTEKELRDIVAFQTSESGRSIAKKSPLVRAQLVNEMMPLVMTNMPTIMHKAVDQACAQAHCDSRQRQIVADALAKALPQRSAS